MKNKIIVEIQTHMQKFLDNQLLENLHSVLTNVLKGYEIIEANSEKTEEHDYLSMFLSSKRVEGRSDKSLKYYQSTIEKMVSKVGKTVKHITTVKRSQKLTT